MAINSKRVGLRPDTESDVPFLYALATHDDASATWRLRGAVPALQDFARTLQDDVLTQFVVVEIKDNRPIGHAVVYGARMRDRLAYLGLAMSADRIRTTVGIEAAILLVDHVFGTWDMRKLYIESPEPALEHFSSAMGYAFVEEGRLRDYSYAHGRYWDTIVAAITKDRWNEIGPTLRGMLERDPRILGGSNA